MENIEKWLKDQGLHPGDFNWSLIKNVVTNALKQDRRDRMADVSVLSNTNVDWMQIELDNDFICIDCNTIVETPYFIATNVPGRCSPLLDGPRCKECHEMTTLERDAKKYKHIEFRRVDKTWDCYSIKYDFFVGNISYHDGNYVFCAANHYTAFNANAIKDISVFLAELGEETP